MRQRRFTLTVLTATLALLVGSLAGFLPGAAAQSDGLMIPDNTVITGNPGDIVELGRVPVDTTLAGPLCTWTASVVNQSSVHPGSDILVGSNGTTLVIADVEATPDKVTSNTGSVALASEVIVSIRLGPDGVFSGGLDLTIVYTSCEQTTTTTTTAVPTTMEQTTTTETTPETSETTETSAATETTAEVTSTTETEVAGPEVSAQDSTTTAPATTTTTAATTTTTEAVDTAVLPVTGSGLAMPLAAVGFMTIGLGLALSHVSKNRQV